MTTNKQARVAVIVLNWNGEEDSIACIEALRKQSFKHQIIAVDNNSSDGFYTRIKNDYKEIVNLRNTKNKGFSGGVNTGIRHALNEKYDYVALINNDAVPEKDWLKNLVHVMDDTTIGIVTGKLLKMDGNIDSTGDQYTSWGLPYPRGRNEPDNMQYSMSEEVFSGTGGASLYRREMLEQVGLFDESFFMYFEDVDISFRARLADWRVVYTPNAIAYHKVGASSSKVPGFTTYMTIKNLPWLMWKNTPLRLLPVVLPRFTLAYISIIGASLARGKIFPTLRGLFMTNLLLPKKLLQRQKIQRQKKVDYLHIMSHMTYDLPPNARKLRRLRDMVRKLRIRS